MTKWRLTSLKTIFTFPVQQIWSLIDGTWCCFNLKKINLLKECFLHFSMLLLMTKLCYIQFDIDEFLILPLTNDGTRLVRIWNFILFPCSNVRIIQWIIFKLRQLTKFSYSFKKKMEIKINGYKLLSCIYTVKN